jgi:hypothetical protein
MKASWISRYAERFIPRDRSDPVPHDLKYVFELFFLWFILWALGVIVVSAIYAVGADEPVPKTLALACAASGAAFGAIRAAISVRGSAAHVVVDSRVLGELSPQPNCVALLV